MIKALHKKWPVITVLIMAGITLFVVVLGIIAFRNNEFFEMVAFALLTITAGDRTIDLATETFLS